MIKQNHHPASERFYECLNCDLPTTNPLCPDCLTLQIEAWLSSYPDLGKKVLPILKIYLKKSKELVSNSTQCVACGKKQAHVCPYCFTDFVLTILKGLEVNKLILVEFLQFFNFDFEHTGYTKDAEKLGML